MSGGIWFTSYQHPIVLLMIHLKLGGGKGKQKDFGAGVFHCANLKEGEQGGPGYCPSTPIFLLTGCFQHIIHEGG